MTISGWLLWEHKRSLFHWTDGCKMCGISLPSPFPLLWWSWRWLESFPETPFARSRWWCSADSPEWRCISSSPWCCYTLSPAPAAHTNRENTISPENWNQRSKQEHKLTGHTGWETYYHAQQQIVYVRVCVCVCVCPLRMKWVYHHSRYYHDDIGVDVVGALLVRVAIVQHHSCVVDCKQNRWLPSVESSGFTLTDF